MKNSTKTTLAAAACALIFCGALGGIIYWVLMPASKPVGNKPADIAKFVASNKFDDLKLSQKQEYLDKLGSQGWAAAQALPEADRGKLMEKTMEVMEQQMSKTVKQYCSLKTQEEKDKYLDEYMAKEKQRWETMRANRPPRTERPKTEGENVKKDDTQKQPPKRDPAAFASRMKDRMEKTAPEERAARTQFYQDLMARRQQTGQTGGGRGPGGGGGGRPR